MLCEAHRHWLHRSRHRHSVGLRNYYPVDTCAALATSGGRGGGGAAAAEAAAVSSAGSAADGIADERWARAMLAPGDAPPTLAAWSGSLLGRAALGLRGLLSEVKGAPPHPSWTADHGAPITAPLTDGMRSAC